MDHPVVQVGRSLLARYALGGSVPLDAFRAYLAEVEAALGRDGQASAPADDRNAHGYPTTLGSSFLPGVKT